MDSITDRPTTPSDQDLDIPTPPIAEPFAGFGALVEDWRRRLTEHFDAGRPAEALPLQRRPPADKSDFAIVGILPRRKHESAFYACSFCERAYQFGNDGKVVLSQSDMGLRLIGPDCHARHFEGNRYAEALADHRAYERRQKFELLRKQLQTPLHAATRAAYEMLFHHERTLIEIAELPATLTAAATPLVAHLRNASFVGGALRTFNENEEPSLFQQAGGRNYGGRQDFRTIHVAVGLNAILNRQNPREELTRALDQFRAVKVIIEETHWEELTNRKADRMISSVRASLDGAFKSFNAARSAINDVKLFFSERNLAGIVRWANDNDSPLWFQQRGMKEIPSGILWEPDYGNAVRIVAPSHLRDLAFPDTSDIEQIIRTL
ncbi:hypothetical protein G3576_28750 [Roseomonas stagni]|uniref:Uncharacterized protein n=1 Tax=Falsiroseomonas algicola TaxID=2716930 RepID=A0A6M1LU88_9PROT|nr:hypothetical protein [Falsiroseomonas algicola]NGM24030.1 hypothetical protein [Falsiroseomonas algicola]